MRRSTDPDPRWLAGHSRRAGGWVVLAAAALGPSGVWPAAAQVPDPGSIQDQLAAAGGGMEVAGEPVRRAAVVQELYERSGFAPLWTSREAAAALRAAIAEAREDGLEPDAYHLRAIGTLEEAAESLDARAAAELDVLRTAALVELVHDLRWGRARPGSVPPPAPDAGPDTDLLLRILAASDPRAEIAAVRPDHFVYRGLRSALGQLRAVERRGGWGTVPAGAPLREGAFDARVLSLRERLAAEGYLPGTQRPSAAFDTTLARAVRAFQHHHGLNEDGVVGRASLTELNVPVAERIAQVRVNLERARWITPGLPDTFVVVNIAGGKVYLVRDARVVHESRAVVGSRYTRTPVFSSHVEQVELNPAWTVPASIVDEVLAALRDDPDHLVTQGFRVLDDDGRELKVAPADLLSRADAFPWVLRQDPGPLNPLGRIKLTFPNPHSVYLHDTPERSLFEREDRLFSHGCIRIQDPLALAALLIDRPEWSKESLDAAIAAGSAEIIRLERPVFILVQYWTASADEEGLVHFYRDVYARDAAVLAALQDIPDPSL